VTSTQRAVSREAQATASVPAAVPAKRLAHKRADGEGSISPHKSGLWRGRLMVGYLPDGKPDVREVYGKTQQECRRKLAELRRRAEQGMLPSSAADRQTVAALVGRWLEASKGSLGGRTWQRYATVARLHILPDLGRIRLGALRADDLQRLYARKLEAGLSPLTVRYLHAVIHRALHEAVQWGELPRNVADAAKKPAPLHREIHPPTPAELRTLLDRAEERADPLRALWATAVYSGCREGELLGLTWDDVDLDAGTLAIRRTLTGVVAGVPSFDKPKTQRSQRTVKLAAYATAALRTHRQRQLADRLALGTDYAPYRLVFASHVGTPLLRRNVLRSFKAALALAGLPPTVRFHDLRHAAATLMLAAGVHPKVAAERLGHSDVRMTLNVYSHVLSGLDADAADRLERAVHGAAPS